MIAERFAKDSAGIMQRITDCSIGIWDRARLIWWFLSGVENDVEEDWLSKLEREVEEADHLGRTQLLLVVQ